MRTIVITLTVVWMRPSRNPAVANLDGASAMTLPLASTVLWSVGPTPSGGDVAVSVQVRALAKPGEGSGESTLVDNRDACWAIRMAGGVRGHRRDALGGIQIRCKEEVIFAAREPGAEDRHRPASAWCCAGGDAACEAEPLSANRAGSLRRGHVWDNC